MDETIEVTCPYCGERSTIEIDAAEGVQEFVQDCPVCCRPWQVRVRVGPNGSAEVTLGGDSD